MSQNSENSQNELWEVINDELPMVSVKYLIENT